MTLRRIHRSLNIEELEPRIAPSVVWIGATDPTASEQGGDNGVFTVYREDTVGDLVVYYTTGGTATSGSDYIALSGAVTIGAGDASATITVAPVDDSKPEPDETVILTLSTSGDYVVGIPASATVIIERSDLPVVTIVADDATVAEAGGRSEERRVGKECRV